MFIKRKASSLQYGNAYMCSCNQRRSELVKSLAPCLHLETVMFAGIFYFLKSSTQRIFSLETPLGAAVHISCLVLFEEKDTGFTAAFSTLYEFIKELLLLFN